MPANRAYDVSRSPFPLRSGSVACCGGSNCRVSWRAPGIGGEWCQRLERSSRENQGHCWPAVRAQKKPQSEAAPERRRTVLREAVLCSWFEKGKRPRRKRPLGGSRESRRLGQAANHQLGELGEGESLLRPDHQKENGEDNQQQTPDEKYPRALAGFRVPTEYYSYEPQHR